MIAQWNNRFLLKKIFAEEDISVPESSKASIERREQDSPHEGVIRHAAKKQDNRRLNMKTN